jgi:phosphopantothenoylcysteine decarboxylase/phosphopantothenate--cysteine ligase
MMLKGKNILFGVCGSIASYKSAEITRLFAKAGANVKIIMTQDATAFITPLTLSTLSKNPVLTAYYNQETGEWNNHVELALWADVMLIAPITANTIAKFANGLCDNLLAAIYLSAKCPVYFAPAMDLDMWLHQATQDNLKKLQSFGNLIIQPGNGELASGLSGVGRMEEPEAIFETIVKHFQEKLELAGKKVLITAGPTYEAIDPVRFIGNHSSGKMGFALALACANRGAEVSLVAGPTDLEIDHPLIQRINVSSAQEMFDATFSHFGETDICIMSAAVADYTPIVTETKKIKKNTEEFNLSLKKTKDIAKHLGAIKTKQILVGFALETDHEEANALAKLKSKNLDFIVLNSLNDKGAGFKGDQNKITIIKENEKKYFDLKSKNEVASDIINEIITLL